MPPSGVAIDVKLHKLDRAVWGELPDNREHRYDRAGGDENPVLGPTQDQFTQIIEADRELFDHAQQQEHLARHEA